MKEVVSVGVFVLGALLLSGCYVQQDEYDAKVRELTDAQQQVEELSAENATLKETLEDTQKKLGKSERLTLKLQKDVKEAETSELRKRKEVQEAEQKTATMETKLEDAISAQTTLEKELAEKEQVLASLRAQFEQYKKNALSVMNGGVAPTTIAPIAPVEKTPVSGDVAENTPEEVLPTEEGAVPETTPAIREKDKDLLDALMDF